jgi:HEAT repeat protein
MSARERLKNATARPETAAALAGEGDPAVLPALVEAFDDPVETGGDALLDAMRALAGGAAARRLASSDDAGDRRVAARLMSLLPEPEHLAALEPLLVDPDPAVAGAARKALRHQWRTPEWHAAVERLAGSEDPSLREAAEVLRNSSRAS